ncbi:MAG: rSAM/selenodomain-associated transferase 1 [Psychromonas sp.]|jgi:rSAM/selenodomain-associated transferase 1
MKDALIIFQKNPEPGKVKTRLAATIGNEKALIVYKVLVDHTHRIVSELEADKFLYFSSFIDNSAEWNGYNKKVQKGDDLGLRMYNAIEEVRALGYERIIVIGTDCFELSSEIVTQAFLSLRESDCVIGPAIDGGYYLIGTHNPDKEVFIGKEWSTENVFVEATKNIASVNKTLSILEALPDVDYEEDLKSLKDYIV